MPNAKKKRRNRGSFWVCERLLDTKLLEFVKMLALGLMPNLRLQRERVCVLVEYRLICGFILYITATVFSANSLFSNASYFSHVLLRFSFETLEMKIIAIKRISKIKVLNRS